MNYQVKHGAGSYQCFESCPSDSFYIKGPKEQYSILDQIEVLPLFHWATFWIAFSHLNETKTLMYIHSQILFCCALGSVAQAFTACDKHDP
jgi:hypothetical protein